MRRLILLLAAALLAATAGAPSAAAASPWNAPVTISAPHTFAQPVGLVSTNTSNAAYWQWQQGVGGDSDVGESFASRPPGGTFSVVRTATRAG